MKGERSRANASKLLLITTKVKNQRKNQDFALDYFLSPKAIAENFRNKQELMTLISVY